MGFLIPLFRSLLPILIVVTMFAGCSDNADPLAPSESSHIKSKQSEEESLPTQESKPMPLDNPLEISPQAVKTKLDQKEDFILIDCREQDEFDLVHIAQSQLVSLSELEQKTDGLKDLQEKEIIVYCHHGRRSMTATKWLLDHGFTNVKSMAGGIDLWSEQIDSELQRY